jgi:hypothetical protein
MVLNGSSINDYGFFGTWRSSSSIRGSRRPRGVLLGSHLQVLALSY